MTIFGDIDLPMVVNVIVYDSKTVSIVEQSKSCTYHIVTSIMCNTARAMKCAELLYALGSKNPVKVLKGTMVSCSLHITYCELLSGGYERFSAEYPFLRTQKIIYASLVCRLYSTYALWGLVNHDIYIIHTSIPLENTA